MDIVERLREPISWPPNGLLLDEAADEIERLRNLLQNGSPVVEGTIQHMAMEIAELKKQRDEAEADKLETYQRLCESRAKHKAALEQRDELVADAKRYRWLRDTQEGKTVRIMDRREWDFAIDEALAKLGADKEIEHGMV